MPAESAILAHAPDLASALLARMLSGENSPPFQIAGVSDGDRGELAKALRLAEAETLVSLCEEALWEDYRLAPALRDEFTGKGLGDLGRKVLSRDGRTVRDIRIRGTKEALRLRDADAGVIDALAVDGTAVGSTQSADEFERVAKARYVDALAQWIAPATMPEPLRKRVLASWYARFGAAFRAVLKNSVQFRELATDSSSPGEDRRFDELQRQSWRLDEILSKLDKWELTNPGAKRSSAYSYRTVREPTGAGSRKPYLAFGIAGVIVAAALAWAYWVTFTPSPGIRAFVARAQVERLEGVSQRIVRNVAWLDAAPIPGDIFAGRLAALQEAGDAEPVAAEQVDDALFELQQKQICRAAADGWLFHERIRADGRLTGAAGIASWQRALSMVLATAPADAESPENVREWRLLVPHLIALFESAPGIAATDPAMQRLLAALAEALLAIRIEPGRRPASPPGTRESDDLYKRISVFVEAANKFFEREQKTIEGKFGRFSNEMVVAHKLRAEIAWHLRDLKQEQDSWVRAIRALDKQEPRDVRAIAFCNLRNGISRAVGGDNLGADEAFGEALKVVSAEHGEQHPAVAWTRRKVARVYADLGQYQLAFHYFKAALESLAKSYPVLTTEIAELHDEVAEFLIDHRNFAEGLPMLDRSLATWQAIEYPTSPEIARVYGVIADVRMLEGRMEEAEKSARKRHELLVSEDGASGAAVRDATIDLAVILIESGDRKKADEAKALLKPFVQIPLDSPVPDDADSALARCIYARTLVATEDFPDAVSHFDRGMLELLNTQPRPSYAVAVCLRGYGQALSEIKRKPDDRKTLEDAEAELSALSRLRPRYTRIAAEQSSQIRSLITKLQP